MKINKMKCRVKCDLVGEANNTILKKDTIGYLHIGYDEDFGGNCIVFELDETEEIFLAMVFNWLFDEIDDE